jgi:hypothetical protein
VACGFALAVVRLPLGQVWKWATVGAAVFWIFACLLLVAMLRFLDPYTHALSQLKYQFSLLEMIRPNYNPCRQKPQIIAWENWQRNHRDAYVFIAVVQVLYASAQVESPSAHHGSA